MERQLLQKTLLVAAVVVAIAVAFTLGVMFGYEERPAVSQITELFDKEVEKPPTVDFSPFWRAWQVINEKYVDTSTSTAPATTDERVWGAIQGLVWSLGDPYSAFLPPSEQKLFEEEISGNFGGVGIEIGRQDDLLTVISALPGTPAKRAGIEPGDRVLEIDDAAASTLSITEAVGMIRGEVGTSVRLKFLRGDHNESYDVTLVRAKIDVPTIKTEEADGVYTITLYNFGATASRLFAQAVESFAASGSDKLLIDLRGNAGGFLEAAIDIASWFVPASQRVVIEDRGQGEPPAVYESRGHALAHRPTTIAILVDGGTASAAEIVAGALQDNKLATLVGEKTFGKGSVQELVSITEDTSLKITVARWLTPLGHSISENGLIPDIVVADGEEGAGDRQKERAIAFLRSSR